MKILSLDLSSKASGYAIIDNKRLVKTGVIEVSGSSAIGRIKEMQKRIREIIEDNLDIDVIAIEEVRPDGSKNLHTFKILMYVQAAVEFLVHDLLPKAKIVYLYPSEWRSRCGIKSGRGIQREKQKQLDIEFVSNLFGITVGDDEADAIGIGVAYAIENEIQKGES